MAKKSKSKAKTAGKSKATPKTKKWYGKPIFVAATLGVVGLAALGVLRGPLQSPTTTPSTGPSPQGQSLLTRIKNVAHDLNHGQIRPGTQFDGLVFQPGKMKIVLPKDARCYVCHRVAEFPETLRMRFEAEESRLKELFPAETIHSKLQDGLMMFHTTKVDEKELMEGSGDTFAETTSRGIDFKIAPLADPVIREQTYGHELAHYMTNIMSDYLPETWAYGATALIKPPSVFQDVDIVYHSRKYAAILSRAALANGHDIGRIRLPEYNEDGMEKLNALCRTVTSEDQEAFKPIFREAYREYRKNNLYWDTAAYKYRNPYIVFDVLLAQHMQYRQDPELMKRISNPTQMIRVMQNFNRMHQGVQHYLNEEVRNLPEETAKYERIKKLDGKSHDLWANTSELVPSHIPQKVVDGEYFAGIHGNFMNPDGSIRYDAVDSNELRAQARLKIDWLKKVTQTIRQSRKELRTKVFATAEHRRMVSGRLEQSEALHRKLLSELNEMMRTGRFIH